MVNYKIIRSLGSGYYANVFLAATDENEFVALKIYKMNATMKDIENELSCLLPLRKNCNDFSLCFITLDSAKKITNLHSFVKTSYHDDVIVTDFLEGYITLDEFIRNKKYNEEFYINALKIRDNFISIVKKLHGFKMTHNDLHLNNIMINLHNTKEPKYNLKIIDLGLCTPKAYNIFKYSYDYKQFVDTIWREKIENVYNDFKYSGMQPIDFISEFMEPFIDGENEQIEMFHLEEWNEKRNKLIQELKKLTPQSKLKKGYKNYTVKSNYNSNSS